MGDKKHIADFLIGLSEDPEKLEAYKQDPETALKAAGIDGEDLEVVKTGDADKIRAHLGEDDPPGCLFYFLVAII